MADVAAADSSQDADESRGEDDKLPAPAPRPPPTSAHHQWLPRPDGTAHPRSLPLSLPPSALSALASSCPLPPDVFSLVRQWAGGCRDRMCPPSSYSTSTRSSYTLIDGAACIGFAALTFVRRADVFHRLVACESDAKWSAALTANVAAYQRAERIAVRQMHWMRYFDELYEKETPFACLYLDPSLPSLPALRLSPANDDFHFDPPVRLASSDTTCSTLSEAVRYMLSHPSHPIPLLLLKLPSSFDTRLLCTLARATAEEAAIAKAFHFKFLILAGSSSLPSATLPTLASSSAAPKPPTPAVSLYGDPSLPPASSRHQLHYLFNSQHGSHPDLFQRLKQIMSSQLWNCPQAQAQLWSFFTSTVSSSSPSPPDDETLYDSLRAFYHQRLLPTPECTELRQRKAAKGAQCGCGTDDGRANSRVKELVAQIRRHRFPPSLPPTPATLLDVGCSEGSITASLAAALNIPPTAAHGCDVRELPTRGFTFRLVTGSRLPYEDGSMQLVLALMSLHHIEEVEETLREVRRVLVLGGLLVVREHDLSFPALAVLLDVMHGLYARVWSDPPEQPHFCSDYYALYRPRREWQRLMEGSGLVQVEGSDDRRGQPWDGGVKVRRDHRGGGDFISNPFQFYYALYSKPSSTTALPPPPPSAGHKRGREAADDEKEPVKRSAPNADYSSPSSPG